MSADDKEMSRSLKRSPEIDWDKPVECKAIRGDWWPVVHRCVSSTGCVAFAVECPDDGSIQLWKEGGTGYRFRNVRRKVKHQKTFHYLLGATGSVGSYAEEDAKELAAEGGGEYRRVDIEWEAEVDE